VALLSGAAHLRELGLDHTEVTDAAVPLLVPLAGLKSLDLYHTKISQEGVKRVREALPECRVVWELDSAGRRGI
jgi:hypothetical protein